MLPCSLIGRKARDPEVKMAPVSLDVPFTVPNGNTTDSPRIGCFLWGCQLSRDSIIHALSHAGSNDAERHTLELKQAVLGGDAVEGDRNVVEVSAADADGTVHRHLLTSLTVGLKEQAPLDFPLSWTGDSKIAFKLVRGSGPVFINGNHHVVDDSIDLLNASTATSLASSAVDSDAERSDVSMKE
jgi:hypothetical protein